MGWEEQIAGGRVAIAMSGGVDSTVVAALVARQGADAFGITARMTDGDSIDDDIQRAAAACGELGIEHHVVDLRAEFESAVVEDFVAAYIGGETPSPCVTCNREIKFGALLDKARGLGADLLATGHYVRCVNNAGAFSLLRGADTVKDQAYFLARLTEEQLRCSLFPLGEMRKQDVQALAIEYGLKARASRESQDLCFLGGENHGQWLDDRAVERPAAGDIVDIDGKVVGCHRGLHYYTIGQRKGLGVALGQPVYVVELDAENNRVVVSTREHVMSREFMLRDMRLFEQSTGSVLECQVRYNHRPAECELKLVDDGQAYAVFAEEQFAVTPGQLAVFYAGERVVASGWIVKTDETGK